MAFMDKFGTMITTLADKGATKTKELKDTAKYSMDIRNTEAAINSAYREIGKSYFEAHKDDEDPEFYQVEEIKELLREIDRLKEARDEVRGLTKCPHCGEMVRDTDRFCNACGKKIEKPAEHIEAEIVSGGVLPEAEEEFDEFDEADAEGAAEVAEEATEAFGEGAAEVAEEATEAFGEGVADSVEEAAETVSEEAVAPAEDAAEEEPKEADEAVEEAQEGAEEAKEEEFGRVRF